jgi:hypothetical protein
MHVLKPTLIRFSLLLACALPLCGHAQVTYFGPTPYAQQSDTPAGFSSEPTVVENMEDGVLDPRISAPATGIIGPGGLTDSVDIDDGLLNGNGSNGRSLFANTPDMSIVFPNVQSAGLVWTDGESAQVTFEAFDTAGVSLGVHGPFPIGDGNITGQTAEDRFFGARSSQGISRIRIRHTVSIGGLEIDHVQFSSDAIFANGFE